MDVRFIEKIWNKPAPPHDIYQDPCSGLYGECFNVDGNLVYSDIPLCEYLSVLRNIIWKYDKWLGDFRAVNCDGETYIGLSKPNIRFYWRRYKHAHNNFEFN